MVEAERDRQEIRGKVTINEYQDLFVQPRDRWGFKRIGKSNWIINDSTERPYATNHTQNHLNGKYAIATLGKWYPAHMVFDIDGKDFEYISELQEKLGLHKENHMVCESETPGNYHILIRPTYNGKPPTLNLLNDVIQPFAKQNGIEAYPQKRKPFRLPFSPIQRIVDEALYFVDEWEEKLYWFLKLDEYDLKQVPKHQQFLPLEYPQSRGILSTYEKGRELFLHGLQHPSSRNDGQFEVLYYLWRQNVALRSAVETTYQWICKKHNGYSKEISLGRFTVIKKEIQRQADHIYSHYDLPDTTHVSYAGYITKEDIKPIFVYSRGSLLRARFLFHLLKYYYPRKLLKWVPITRENLAAWSSYTNYQKRIDYFRDWKILDRKDFYISGKVAKPIVINWEWKPIEKAVLHDNRSPDTLEETVRECMEPGEIRSVLKTAGMKAPNVSGFIKTLYGRTRKTE